jgi:putative heme iron utilization protein
MLKIHDEFSCYYEDENMNVDLERITTFLQDEYIGFKHQVLNTLRDAYEWSHSEEKAIEDLQDYEFLKDGSFFYE